MIEGEVYQNFGTLPPKEGKDPVGQPVLNLVVEIVLQLCHRIIKFCSYEYPILIPLVQAAVDAREALF